MFTIEQINEQLSKVKTGADFPALVNNLKNTGVTYYETRMEDGRSTYHGPDHFELHGGPNYLPIKVADDVNPEKLKIAIANHRSGRSGYLQISRECADNGIDRWAVCLLSMTCTYMDKAGNKVWVENIPDLSNTNLFFTIAQIKEAHSKVKSGADFPAYIQDIKKLGVTSYETHVVNGNTNYRGSMNYHVSGGPRYEPLIIADISSAGQFRTELKAHQEGKTSFLTFCNDCARLGIERWAVCLSNMTCTYYDKSGQEILVEEIPQ